MVFPSGFAVAITWISVSSESLTPSRMVQSRNLWTEDGGLRCSSVSLKRGVSLFTLCETEIKKRLGPRSGHDWSGTTILGPLASETF